ncbi:MAG: hypothetical protein ACK40T_09145 [Akkermansiaceae bacterium]
MGSQKECPTCGNSFVVPMPAEKASESAGVDLAQWIDPEIALMEAELEKMKAELADLETEQAELGHLISRFQAAHNKALGERLRKLLKLRMQALEREIKTKPQKQAAYEQANRDFEEFEKDQETQKKSNAKSDWNLTKEEQNELKSLFRKGSKKCHPDLVPPEHHDAAAQMFRELREAYDRGDLERLRQLVEKAESGSFLTSDQIEKNAELKKEQLKAKIAGLSEALEKAQKNVDTIKCSKTYKTMMDNSDWSSLFEKQALLLDHEIISLTKNNEIQQDDT